MSVASRTQLLLLSFSGFTAPQHASVSVSFRTKGQAPARWIRTTRFPRRPAPPAQPCPATGAKAAHPRSHRPHRHRHFRHENVRAHRHRDRHRRHQLDCQHRECGQTRGEVLDKFLNAISRLEGFRRLSPLGTNTTRNSTFGESPDTFSYWRVSLSSGFQTNEQLVAQNLWRI